MFRARYLPDDVTVDVAADESLLTAAVAADVPHARACGGDGICSTCRVMVFAGLENCSPRTRKEDVLARRLAFPPEVRLACQTTIAGEVTVRRLVLDSADEVLADQRERPPAPTRVGDMYNVAILFADIRNFTAMSETLLPYDVIHLLNRYLSDMDEVITRHDGYLSSVAGDGLMAIFGIGESPAESPARAAVRAGFDMLDAVDGLQSYVEWLHGKKLRISIGIHCGPAAIGEVGGNTMRLVTAVGDVVNMAQRVEAANRLFDTSFIVSEDTYLEVADEVDARPLRPIELAGKSGQFVLYQVVRRSAR